MKKKLLLLAFLAIGVGCVNASTPKVASAAFTPSNWRHVKVIGENTYSVSEESIISNNNREMRNNYFVTDEYDAIGDYEISVDIQGEMGFPNQREVQSGIVPWYIDDANYIIAYMNWSATERPSQMRQIQITGRINGQNMVVWKDGFVQGEWNDIWTDGRTESSADKINFKVRRVLSEDKDTYLYYTYINDEQIGFYGFREAIQHASKPASIGVYGFNDEITFTNFTYTNLNTVGSYANVKDGVVAKSSDNAWTNNENDYTITTSGTNWADQMVVMNNSIHEEKYKVSATVNVSNVTDSSAIGLLAWYQDEYNYLGAIIKKENGETKMGFNGKTTVLLGSTMTVNEINEVVPVTMDFATITAISLIKQGSKYTLSVNNDAHTITYENASLLKAARYGAVAANVSANFINLICEEIPYNPYDWFSSNLGTSTTYYISAKTDENPVSYNSGSYVFNANAVDTTDNTKRSAIYFPSKKTDNVTITANFTNVTDNTVYGLYGWIENAENYLLVEVSKSGIVVTNHFGANIHSQSFTLPAGVSFAGGTKDLTVEIVANEVLVKWYGMKVVKTGDFAIVGHDKSLSPNVGITCAGTAVTANDVRVSGYSAYQEVQQGNWKLYGPHYDTWKVDEEAKTIESSLLGGTDWKQVNAIHPQSEKKDFYMSAIMNVYECSGTEFKAGFMPYYLNGDNHVIVWLSQWAGASPAIVITGRLNGQAIGNEWRETTLAYDYVGTDNKVEIQIEGNQVKVFLNQSYNPSFITEFDGLENRVMENAYVGFNLYNTAVKIKDYTLCSDERQFALKEKPVINESNKRTTEGVVGDEIKLPIFTASNAAGDILTANVLVSDPDGEEVTISRNRFTASKVGVYKVKVTCEDNWGNVADPIEYDITITDGTTEPGPGDGESSTGGEVENPSSGGCSSCGNAGTNVVTVLSLVTLLAFVVLKKKD